MIDDKICNTCGKPSDELFRTRIDLNKHECRDCWIKRAESYTMMYDSNYFSHIKCLFQNKLHCEN